MLFGISNKHQRHGLFINSIVQMENKQCLTIYSISNITCCLNCLCPLFLRMSPWCRIPTFEANHTYSNKNTANIDPNSKTTSKVSAEMNSTNLPKQAEVLAEMRQLVETRK